MTSEQAVEIIRLLASIKTGLIFINVFVGAIFTLGFFGFFRVATKSESLPGVK